MPKSPPRRRGSRKSCSDLYVHSRNQFRLRYLTDLTQEQHARLGEMIRNKQGEFLLEQTGSRTIWKLKPDWLDFEVYAVYQKPMSAVCTVLSQYMVEQILREHTPMEDAA